LRPCAFALNLLSFALVFLGDFLKEDDRRVDPLVLTFSAAC